MERPGAQVNHGLRLLVCFLAAAPIGFSALSFVFGPVALGLWSYNRGEQCIVHPTGLLEQSGALEQHLTEVEQSQTAFSAFNELDRAFHRKAAASQMLQVTTATTAAAIPGATTAAGGAGTTTAAATTAAATKPPTVPPPPTDAPKGVFRWKKTTRAPTSTPVRTPPGGQGMQGGSAYLPPARRPQPPIDEGSKLLLWLLVTGCVGTVLGVFMVVTVVHDAVWAREMDMMQGGHATRLWLDIKAFLYQPWFFFDVVGLSLVFMTFVFLLLWLLIGTSWLWGHTGSFCKTQAASLWGNMNGFLIAVWLAALASFVAMVAGSAGVFAQKPSVNY